MKRCQGFSMSIGQKTPDLQIEAQPGSKEKVYLLWKEGYSTTEISKTLGISTQSVRKHFKTLGIDASKRNNKKQEHGKYDNEIKILVNILKKNPLINISDTIRKIFNEDQNKDSILSTLVKTDEYIEVSKLRKELIEWKKEFLKAIEDMEKTETYQKLFNEVEILHNKISSIPPEHRVPIEASIMKRATSSTRRSDLYWDREYIQAVHQIRILEDKKHSLRVNVIREQLKKLDKEKRSLALNFIIDKHYVRTYSNQIIKEVC